MSWVKEAGDKAFEKQVKKVWKEADKYFTETIHNYVADAEDIAGYITDVLTDELSRPLGEGVYEEMYAKVYKIVSGGDEWEDEVVEDVNDGGKKKADLARKKYKVVVKVDLAYVVEANDEQQAKETIENIELSKYYVEDSFEIVKVVPATPEDENLYTVTEFI